MFDRGAQGDIFFSIWEDSAHGPASSREPGSHWSDSFTAGHWHALGPAPSQLRCSGRPLKPPAFLMLPNVAGAVSSAGGSAAGGGFGLNLGGKPAFSLQSLLPPFSSSALGQYLSFLLERYTHLSLLSPSWFCSFQMGL